MDRISNLKKLDYFHIDSVNFDNNTLSSLIQTNETDFTQYCPLRIISVSSINKVSFDYLCYFFSVAKNLNHIKFNHTSYKGDFGTLLWMIHTGVNNLLSLNFSNSAIKQNNDFNSDLETIFARLFEKHKNLEYLNFNKFNVINDTILKHLSEFNVSNSMREIHLKYNKEITVDGVKFFLDHNPNLRFVDFSFCNRKITTFIKNNKSLYSHIRFFGPKDNID